MAWQPDYRHIVDAAYNRRPKRLPLYEHAIDPKIMEAVLGQPVRPPAGSASQAELVAYHAAVARFWRQTTYDAISYEAAIVGGCWDNSGAIFGGRPGPIQNREDFNRFAWDQIPGRFWKCHRRNLDALRPAMPEGMKAIGGCGFGVFEISEDLVGYEWLCLMQYDAPQLFADLYKRIGDMMAGLWSELLRDYGDLFCVCRMGDDLGYRAGTMLAPDTIRQHILPQYRRIIDLCHRAGKPFLLHSCGKIFDVMDDVIGLGIQAKHSNEDGIAPFPAWIERYGKRIGLFGGIDVDVLCRSDPQAIFEEVLRQGTLYRNSAAGYALGSGNSIPAYVPVENYMAMVRAGQEIRRREG